ncbi:Pentatricopeptide repeat-containing protein [Nymphaea thermarum]|nr:Pentatricopeptide repeat-containing protein [Nymphaea thermarum]
MACQWKRLSSASWNCQGGTERDDCDLATPVDVRGDDLRGRILRLRFPKKSAADAIKKWVDEGKGIRRSELRSIAKQLVRSRRYKHALEIFQWLDTEVGFSKSAADHAIMMDCMIKVHGLYYGEQYFENLHDSVSRKAACMPLLHSYVVNKAVENAEALMLKLQQSGLAVDAHPFNAMMKLYMATGSYKRVPLVIRQMKHNKIPLNVLSYNLWMNACALVSGVGAAEKVYEEMVINKNLEVGWSTLSTLAHIYVNANLVSKAVAALQMAEQKLSPKKHLGYFFLLTLYARANIEEGVLRVWKLIQRIEVRLTSTNYMCILLSLMKVGNIREAEMAFHIWESECHKYDIRVSNVLLGAYMREGWMDKAESLHLHTLRKGGCPNYKTWEIFMEGWVKAKEMDKAIEAMKKGFSKMKSCNWKPSSSALLAIAEYFEFQKNVDGATKYIKTLHQLRLATGPLYKTLLRLYICTRRSATEILKMIEKDKVDLDEEALALLKDGIARRLVTIALREAARRKGRMKLGSEKGSFFIANFSIFCFN